MKHPHGESFRSLSHFGIENPVVSESPNATYFGPAGADHVIPAVVCGSPASGLPLPFESRKAAIVSTPVRPELV